jgi:hypothetical protein
MTTKSEGRCGDWKAWHDNQPPGPKTLYVTGKCTFNTGGYSVQLKPHEPQGINPAIYLMDKIVKEPTGNVNQQITTVDVRYSEKTDRVYSEVNILPDDAHVPVKEVQ